MSSPPPGPPILTLGKYNLIANLGHGGMADVFLAVVRGPVGFHKLQVIKRPRSTVAEEPELLAMFLDEARLAARLNHPNVVLTNEVAEVDGVYFIAMEYLDGQPLNRILQALHKRDNGLLGPTGGGTDRARPAGTRELLLRVVADALAGLHHAHELADYDGTPLRVVHRDASPHNIFVTYEGQTKVVDFGIAKAATRSIETQDGVLRGKIAYMAPEQARGQPVDRRADVFAMGLVLWEVLTGARTRKGAEHEVLDSLRTGEVPKVASVWEGCPEALEAIVARATCFAREERYATALEMRQDILAHLDATGARAAQEEVGELVSGLFERKRAEMKGIIERQLASLSAASSGDVGLRALDARTLSASAVELPRAPLLSLPPGALRSDSDRSTVRGPAGDDGARRSEPGPRAPGSGRPAARGVAGEGAPASSKGMGSRSDAIEGARGPRRSRAPVWIGAAAVAAAATVLALSAREKPGAAAPAGTASATGAAGSTPDPRQNTDAPGEATRAADTIEVHVSARPAQARMFLDDTSLLSNPFVGRFRRDDRPHTVRVEAEGHTAVTRAISFASDQKIEIALDRAEPPPASPQDAPAERPASTTSAAASADPSAAASAGEGAPDDDELPPPGSPPRKELDTDDPWK